MDIAATKVNKLVRGFLARRRVVKIKLAIRLYKARETVCRHLRGYWHRRMINWLRSQIRAVVVIQTYFRMYKGKDYS